MIMFYTHVKQEAEQHFCIVGIATATGWTVRGSSPGVGEILRTRPNRRWGPPSLPYKGYRFFPGGKAAGAWR